MHEKPTTFTINLKLHHDAINGAVGDIEYEKDTIVNERLDTIVFESPTEIMYRILKGRQEPKIEGVTLDKIKQEKRRIESAIDFVIGLLQEEPNV